MNESTIESKIDIILRQTDYSRETARTKLEEFKYDEILVIKNFLGINNKKQDDIKSINQEIYKQLRYQLDHSMRDYQKRKERGETKNL